MKKIVRELDKLVEDVMDMIDDLNNDDPSKEQIETNYHYVLMRLQQARSIAKRTV